LRNGRGRSVPRKSFALWQVPDAEMRRGEETACLFAFVPHGTRNGVARRTADVALQAVREPLEEMRQHPVVDEA
jgi:hypothetical protein